MAYAVCHITPYYAVFIRLDYSPARRQTTLRSLKRQFLRAKACGASRVLAIVKTSIRLSVRLSHPWALSKRCKLFAMSCHKDSSFLWQNFVPLGEGVPLERGHERGVPSLKIIILSLTARPARKRLQIGTDMLLTVTCTGNKFYR